MNSRVKKILVTSTICFTLYNTLPSVFYYSNPISSYPSLKESKTILEQWNQNLVANDLEIEHWLRSFSEGLDLNLIKISQLENSRKTIILDFSSNKDVQAFEKNFAKAMTHIPYKNLKLQIAAKDDNTIYLTKSFFNSYKLTNHSKFIPTSSAGKLSNDYKQLLTARADQVKKALLSQDPIDLQLSILKKVGHATKENSAEIISIFKNFSADSTLFQKMVTFAHTLESPWTKEILYHSSEESGNILDKIKNSLKASASSIKGAVEHPFVKTISIDEKNLILKIELHDDINKLKDSPFIKGMLVNLFSNLSQRTGEIFKETSGTYHCNLAQDYKTPVIVTELNGIISELQADTLATLHGLFKPQSSDFSQENFLMIQDKDYAGLSCVDQENCLIVSSAFWQNSLIPKNGAKDSLYIIGRNLEKTLKELEKTTDHNKSSIKDFKQLLNLITALNFKLVPSNELDNEFKNDLVFELKNATQPVWDLLGENHKIYPHLGIAVCELGNVKDRLSKQNHKELKKQEALLKWSNNYQTSLQGLNGLEKDTIAKPTKSPFFANLILNVKHFFRGSEKKSLKFGLDLSGGKNILIQLEDEKGRKVADPENIKTAINELYQRVNHLGVSEVSIRQEGDFISLDFPGSQNLSAKDLVNASSMYFHVVNEEYSYQNPELYPFVDDFLRQVWSEAEQSGNLELSHIQKIGFNLLNSPNAHHFSAKKLKDRGLKLANPSSDFCSHELNHSLSKIVKIKVSDADETTACPLMIVFNNYALEGAALKDITTSYDATKGNYLSFGIQKTTAGKSAYLDPQETLHKWTLQFTKNKGQLTFKPARGWRMAVVLNSEVVSSPVLESALKDAASINGSFTQQDLLKLKSDLQAGSLSFHPKIILEQNIAPELGQADRASGFMSMAISLVLVTALMTCYYRFHGIVATSALVLNLLMLFAAACFLNITLSLASIAGIVLTLGMAVDANVLIFERMREEKNKGSDLKESVYKGYTRAFSAIIDSNLTTMIAAAVLLGFDSGPIKGFALTLLVGLITSVITALFMTKMFYFDWVEKTKTSTIIFSNWFKFENLNFLKHTKKIAAATLLIFVVGCTGLISNFNHIIGMDFKGGYAFNLKIQTNSSDHPIKDSLKNAFVKSGLKETHFHARELNDTHHLRVFLDKNVASSKNESQSWQDYLLQVTKGSPVTIEKDCLDNLDASVSTISGQLSESMTKQAIIGLFVALCAIFVYVLVRFQWAYAMAATLGLFHDVILTLAIMGILSYMNVPVNLDMSSLAAILTIIGYSLNDTIIVFDRVREEVNSSRGASFKEIVLKSLNTTLSRTVMTSATTLIVLIPMIFIGHGTLFNFSLVMTIGVVIGTLSTLFIASPLLVLFFKKKTEVIENI